MTWRNFSSFIQFYWTLGSDEGWRKAGEFFVCPLNVLDAKKTFLRVISTFGLRPSICLINLMRIPFMFRKTLSWIANDRFWFSLIILFFLLVDWRSTFCLNFYNLALWMFLSLLDNIIPFVLKNSITIKNDSRIWLWVINTKNKW